VLKRKLIAGPRGGQSKHIFGIWRASTRNHEVFTWCLNGGLKIVYQMTLMTMGLYNEPNGAYLPSILY
jgi:hypothetical protein